MIDLPNLTIISFNERSFYLLPNLSLTSHLYVILLLIDLPSLTTFEAYYESFYLTKSITMESKSK